MYNHGSELANHIVYHEQTRCFQIPEQNPWAKGILSQDIPFLIVSLNIHQSQ